VALDRLQFAAGPEALTSTMRKTYPLIIEGKHPERVLEAVKHDIRKYIKRERRRPLAEGVDFLDFDCRVGVNAETARISHVAQLIADVDQVAKEGALAVYVEVLAKPAVRQPKPAGMDAAQHIDAED
jgi:hypothetical protein